MKHYDLASRIFCGAGNEYTYNYIKANSNGPESASCG